MDDGASKASCFLRISLLIKEPSTTGRMGAGSALSIVFASHLEALIQQWTPLPVSAAEGIPAEEQECCVCSVSYPGREQISQALRLDALSLPTMPR